MLRVMAMGQNRVAGIGQMAVCGCGQNWVAWAPISPWASKP